jgi:predicted nuclease with TOPRIM domain
MASRSKRLGIAIARIRDELQALEDLQGEYEEWQDNLPENFESSPLGEKLEAAVDVFQGATGEIESQLDELENLELPLGFGRD